MNQYIFLHINCFSSLTASWGRRLAFLIMPCNVVEMVEYLKQLPMSPLLAASKSGSRSSRERKWKRRNKSI